ncbi:MAG: helix-turn-helix domain-containing protein [Terriglobia bacterium]
MKKENSRFKEVIAVARTKSGMTQEQFARRLGVTTSALQKWERGASVPSFELAGRLMGFLGESGSAILYAMGMSPEEIRAMCAGFERSYRSRGRS